MIIRFIQREHIKIDLYKITDKEKFIVLVYDKTIHEVDGISLVYDVEIIYERKLGIGLKYFTTFDHNDIKN